jgi:hypothetical protein
MKARYNPLEGNVLARCPDCDAFTNFETRLPGGNSLGVVVINERHTYCGVPYSRIMWQPLRCAVCNRGAVAKLHDRGSGLTAILEDFIPRAVERAGGWRSL